MGTRIPIPVVTVPAKELNWKPIHFTEGGLSIVYDPERAYWVVVDWGTFETPKEEFVALAHFADPATALLFVNNLLDEREAA
jgi:hypothetical protein